MLFWIVYLKNNLRVNLGLYVDYLTLPIYDAFKKTAHVYDTSRHRRVSRVTLKFLLYLGLIWV